MRGSITLSMLLFVGLIPFAHRDREAFVLDPYSRDLGQGPVQLGGGAAVDRGTALSRPGSYGAPAGVRST